MAAPKGNKNALGNSGGGRLSIKEERAHLDAWQKDQLVAALKKKIASEKYSGFDMFLYLALVEKREKILINWSNKVMADLHDLRGKDGKDLPQPIMAVIPDVLRNNSNKEDQGTD